MNLDMVFFSFFDFAKVAIEATARGANEENFVAMEIIKQLGWTPARVRPYHFRTELGQEVDLVLEDAAGRIVGVETKAAASVDARDLKGLKALAEIGGDRFVRGIVLYLGKNVVPFDKHLHALPVPAIWS